MKIMNNRYLKEFPNCPSEIPDQLLDNEWALRIHGQSLSRLNERGGTSPVEIIVNIERKSYREFDRLDAGACIEKIIKYIQTSEAAT